MRKFSPISCEKAQGALGHAKEDVHAFNGPPFARPWSDGYNLWVYGCLRIAAESAVLTRRLLAQATNHFVAAECKPAD